MTPKAATKTPIAPGVFRIEDKHGNLLGVTWYTDDGRQHTRSVKRKTAMTPKTRSVKLQVCPDGRMFPAPPDTVPGLSGDRAGRLHIEVTGVPDTVGPLQVSHTAERAFYLPTRLWKQQADDTVIFKWKAVVNAAKTKGLGKPRR